MAQVNPVQIPTPFPDHHTLPDQPHDSTLRGWRTSRHELSSARDIAEFSRYWIIRNLWGGIDPIPINQDGMVDAQLCAQQIASFALISHNLINLTEQLGCVGNCDLKMTPAVSRGDHHRSCENSSHWPTALEQLLSATKKYFNDLDGYTSAWVNPAGTSTDVDGAPVIGRGRDSDWRRSDARSRDTLMEDYAAWRAANPVSEGDAIPPPYEANDPQIAVGAT